MHRHPHPRTPGRRFAAAALAALALSAAAVTLAAPANASGKTSGSGDYAVTVNGTTYNPAPGKDVKLKDLTVTSTIRVRGLGNGFDIHPSDVGVYDYTLTGAPDAQRLVTKPTVLFASKVATLTSAQKAGLKLTSLEIKDANVTAIFTMAGGKLKIQAVDGAQGGIFQMEPEFASNVELVHTLGAGVFYFVNPFTGKVNFGDGVDAVASGTNAHHMLIGKDSPQVAAKTFQSGTVTKWSVAPGGRLGGVLGEDGVEITAGASACTSQCQASEQIRGSLPVPPDPVNPTPIG